MSVKEPERRQYGDLGDRILELEIVVNLIKNTQETHHHENKQIFKEFREILLGDGKGNAGVAAFGKSIECLEKSLEEHTKADDRAFSLLRWSIIAVGALNLGELVVLVKMTMGA